METPAEKLPVITKAEQADLLKLIRARERLHKAHVGERKAALIADLEDKLSAIYHYDNDDTWKAAMKEAKHVVSECQEKIAARCAEMGIPAEFAPGIDLGWHGRNQNACTSRRAELRKRGLAKIDELERKALVEITRLSVEAQTEVISHGIRSEAAVAFQQTLRPAEAVMLPLAEDELKMLQGAAR
jgi:hypothetical protein